MTGTTLLIVEDDGILAANLEDMLTRLGYTVLGPVATGEEAISLIDHHQADLVLMDIELAGTLNGIQSAEILTRFSDVPIIFLTGYSQDPLLEQAKSVGPYGYLIKPVSERELIATVTMTLHRHALDRQLKESRVALEKSEARYRHLFEKSPLGIFRTTLDGRILTLNPGMAEALGYSSPEEAISSFTDLSAQFYVDPARRNEFITLLQEHGEVKNFEYQARKKTGEIIWLSTNAKLTATEENSAIGEQVIDGFARDITAAREAEDALRESEQQARDQKKMLELILDTIPVRLFWKDLNLVYLGCNRLFAQDAGLDSPEELIGADDISMGWREQAEAYNRDDRDVIASGQAKLNYEEIQTTPDGKTIWLSTSKVPLRDANNQIIGVLGTYKDITQRKMADERLKADKEDLERRVEQRTLELQETQKQLLHAEKLTAIGKLSASIAHEFNNPLQGILSILNGVKKRATMDAEDRQLLEAAIGEGVRIKNLILTLREFNRPTSGRMMVMDLHKSIDSILLLNKHDFTSKQITIQLNYDEQLPQIVAVPDQIKQVLLNLLSNAVDSCPDPGAVITIATWQENDRIALQIKDTGIGIKPENMGNIFDPFFTTKPEVKGTGLGLSVVHGIIKYHHGEIKVTSEPGEGTTFTILLPIKGPAEDTSNEEAHG